MSSILDALRKLEKEKTERGEVLSTAVAGDILRIDHCRRRRRWLLPAMLVVIMLLVVAATLLLHQAPVSVQPPAVVLPPAASPAVIPAPAPDAVTPPIATSPQPANLPVLSGIVFQAQREARIAILNDLPTMEGADVAGYRLQEILPDHVVLMQDGRSYEVPLFTADSRP